MTRGAGENRDHDAAMIGKAVAMRAPDAKGWTADCRIFHRTFLVAWRFWSLGGFGRLEVLAAWRSKRDIVIHVAVAGTGRDRPSRRARRSGGAKIPTLVVRVETTASAAGIEHGQVRVESLQHDFG